MDPGPDDLSAVLTDLTEGEYYGIRLRGVNELFPDSGDGEYSDIIYLFVGDVP